MRQLFVETSLGAQANSEAVTKVSRVAINGLLATLPDYRIDAATQPNFSPALKRSAEQSDAARPSQPLAAQAQAR
ncbi:MAG: hypothetical protein AB7O68_02115 [Pirellulales bacterium]